MKKNIVIIILVLIIAFLIGMLWEQQNAINKLANGETVVETNAKDDNEKTNSKKDKNQVLSIGDTWTVEGQWNLTINSVKTTDYRNQYSEKEPQQVVYITYTYENLGYEDKDGIMDGLYFNLEPSGNAIVVDGNGEMAYTYPGDITTIPQETPVGAKCTNAQVCAGLDNVSDTIKININKFDGNEKKQTVNYELKVD